MPRKKAAIQMSGNPTLMPVSADVDLIRFEKNLLQIGFFGANETRGKGNNTRRVEQTVTRDGHRVQVAAEFRGSESLGLPSTTDRDKFIALLKIVDEDRARTGIIANPVRFSGYRLIQELGLARNGEIYEEILRWGKRMTDTTITSEHVVYFAAKKIFSDETLHVFRSFKRVGSSKLDGSERQEHYEIVMEDWLVENLTHRYAIPEDFNAYKALTRPTAKGIYGNLHLWFYASHGKPIEKDYSQLCNLLNVQYYPHLSKIRSTMGLALDELVKIKYLLKWDIQKMSSKGGFKLVLTAGEELLRILDLSRGERKLGWQEKTSAAAALIPNGQHQKAVGRLLEQGVLLSKATQLVNVHGDEKILAACDYFEYQLAGPRGKKVSNPAGLLIHCIENDLRIPAWFKESKQSQANQDEAAAEASKAAYSQLNYDLWLESQKAAAFENTFATGELDVRIAHIIAEQSALEPSIKRWSKDAKYSFAKELVWKELRSSLGIASFEEWLIKSAQTSLF